MKFRLLIVFLAVISFQLAKGQETINRCAASEVDQRLRLEDPTYGKNRDQIEQFTQKWIADHPAGTRTVVTIPVVFHVLYNGSAENISDNRINDQLVELNNDYRKLNSDFTDARADFQAVGADCEINFCLAQQDPSGNATTGIIRKSTTKASWSSNDAVKKTAQGGDDAWNRDSYLNIWICDLGSGLLGYAQFPGGAASTDGVVVDYATVGGPTYHGTMAAYDLGRSATHEVGHWLNCYHIWGDDGTGCNGSDLVADTPNQADETYGCPLPTIRISCTNGPDGDMYENYMDYTDDACMVMFTAGQKSRMQALFGVGGSRAAILNSVGCVPPNGSTCNVPTGLNATGVSSTSATLNWSTATGATSYNIQYKPTSSGTWTLTTSTTTSKAISGLSANTQYDFEVQSACSGGATSDYSTIANFTTSAASCSDILEPNNSKNTAKAISVATDYDALIATSTDKDFYSFSNTVSQPNIKVTVTNLPADYDLTLFKTNGTKASTSTNSGTADETAKYNTSTVGTYKVEVYGFSGAFNASSCYRLRVELSSSPWRSGEKGEGFGKDAISIFPNPAQSNFSVLYNSDDNMNVRFNVYNMMGQLVQTTQEKAVEGTNTLNMDFSSATPGFYIIEMINGDIVVREKFEIAR